MKICIFSLGCKVNSYESDVLRGIFEQKGHTVTDKLEKSDVYVLNTCAVTNEAERKSRQCISRVLAQNPDADIFVCGCASQKDHAQFEQYPNVKFVTGNRDKNVLADIILQNQYQKCENEFDISSQYIVHANAKQSNLRAFVKIQDGCNNFCSYCIIPYLRGRSRSRDLNQIIDEVKQLQSQGVKEIVLTGIDMSDFQIDGKKALGQLVESLSFYDGRLRIGSLEEGVVTRQFVEQIKHCKNLCPQFHLSLQSGSDVVLKSMNRKYTTQQYLLAVELLRQNFSNPAITTDVIVGFPTETDAEFENTCNFVQKVGFAQMHIFPYSNRNGTVASKLYKALDGKVLKQRTKILQKIASQMEENYINQNLGETMQVLIEEQKDGYFYGFTPNYLKIRTKLPQKIGQIVQVKLGDTDFEIIKK